MKIWERFIYFIVILAELYQVNVSEVLIKECKRYNKLAQKELYEMYLPLFKGLCRRYAYCDDDAKDMMQEGFIKIFVKIKQFKGQGSFEGWMKRIMINTALSYYGKKSKKEILTANNDFSDKKNFEGSNNADEMELETSDINKGTFGYDIVNGVNFSYDELFSMLDQLPKPFRDVFNLHIIEGYKHKEIAEMFNIDENTSRTRLLRARNMMQEILFKQCVDKMGQKNGI